MIEETKTPSTATPPAEEVVSVRMRQGVFLLGSFLVVVIVGLLAAMVTWIFHPEPPPPCVQDCPPPRLETSSHGGAGLTEAEVYKSSAFGFSVEYPADWGVEDSGSSGIVLSTHSGLLEIVGGKTTSTAAQLISDRIGQFNRTALPDITPVGTLRGAHIGSQEGTGTLFKSTFVPPPGSGQSFLVRIGITVAKRSGLTVIATVLAPYDPTKDQVVGGGEIDYALTEFRWPRQ